jgi:hypothetical protein
MPSRKFARHFMHRCQIGPSADAAINQSNYFANYGWPSRLPGTRMLSTASAHSSFTINPVSSYTILR